MYETAFKVKDGATYRMRYCDPEEVEEYGCAGADTELRGSHGHIIGSMTVLGRRPVRVPGWTNRKGTRAEFVPWNRQGETLTGWIGE